MKQHNYNRSIPENKYNPLAWISPDAVIGDNCWIGAGVVITAGVEIEDNCSISCGVKIYDHDTSYYRVTEGKIKEKHYKVEIGRCSHIGSNSVIIPKNSDIKIGDHCVIGALTLIRHSTPPYTVWAGSPAKMIKRINPADFDLEIQHE